MSAADVLAGIELPTEAAVRDLLAALLDPDTAVRYEPAPRLRAETTAAVAVYADDTGAVRALAGCDAALANVLGAGLALLPRRRVAEGAAAGVVEADLLDGLREVLSICTRLLCVDGGPHVSLVRLDCPPRLPAGAGHALATARLRLDLTVDVPGYGGGALALALPGS